MQHFGKSFSFDKTTDPFTTFRALKFITFIHPIIYSDGMIRELNLAGTIIRASTSLLVNHILLLQSPIQWATNIYQWIYYKFDLGVVPLHILSRFFFLFQRKWGKLTRKRFHASLGPTKSQRSFSPISTTWVSNTKGRFSAIFHDYLFGKLFSIKLI